MVKRLHFKRQHLWISLLLIIMFIRLYVRFNQALNNTIFPEDENEDLGEEETSRLNDLQRKITHDSVFKN